MNERQKRFVLEYMVDGNATEAYLRAGYKEVADQFIYKHAFRAGTGEGT